MTICDDGMRAKIAQATFADCSDEYKEFVKKFSRRVNNTDDCYTPQAVYDAVLAWVRERYQISRSTPIVRPFYPGGDVSNHPYDRILRANLGFLVDECGEEKVIWRGPRQRG